MWSGADLNGDNLRISRAYLWISDHCRVTVRVKVWVRIKVRFRVRFRVANCCIETAGEGDKMRINHMIKTDQWRCAPRPQIRPLHILSHPQLLQCRCKIRVATSQWQFNVGMPFCLWALCGFRGWKNRPTPFSGQMSQKATKLCLSCLLA